MTCHGHVGHCREVLAVTDMDTPLKGCHMSAHLSPPLVSSKEAEGLQPITGTSPVYPSVWQLRL